MSTRPFSPLLAGLLALSISFAQTKRPLTHKDYDSWRAISGQQLAPDGKFLVYGLFPQQGDGHVVIRNLTTGQETRYAAGALPPPPQANEAEEAPPPPRAPTIVFSADSRTLIFSAFPPKAETDQAKREKKPAGQMPKEAMVIVDLASGRSTKIEQVKRFAVPDKAAGFLAYLREAPETKAAPEAALATGSPRPEFGPSSSSAILPTLASALSPMSWNSAWRRTANNWCTPLRHTTRPTTVSLQSNPVLRTPRRRSSPAKASISS